MRQYPKLSIVIPTRERADTLIHTLKTVTSQSYDNLEIIISDNASEDSTKEVVASFDDRRIKYTNTGRRIGMSENWENGLSIVTGDYVMFLGDDDGLLPHACSDIANLIVATSAKAIIWQKPDYTWPSVSRFPNMLWLKCSYGLIEMRGDLLLREVAAGRTSYGRLPVIYSGFVSTSGVSDIKSRRGRFFQCVTPDVYSGIVLAYIFKTYLYSMRPFSINGGSNYSNGLAQSAPEGKLAQMFFNEASLDIDKEFPVIPGAISSCVSEAFCQAKRLELVGSIELNRSRHFMNIYQELIAQPSVIKYYGLSVLANLDLPRRLREKVINQLSLGSAQSGKDGLCCGDRDDVIMTPVDGMIHLNCDKFDVNNSYDACQLVGNLLGKYKIPTAVIKADYFAYALLALTRKAAVLLKNHVLQF